LSFPKILIIGSVGLFAIIGIAAGVKKIASRETKPIAIELSKQEPSQPVKPLAPKVVLKPTDLASQPLSLEGDFPKIDRIHQLFTAGPTKLPIVETVTYDSRVPWLKGRPAWIADYALHYATSRHFIARSLNGKLDYHTQRVSTGSHFNVFRKDRNFQFYLLVDLSLCRMAFYYIDLDTNERVLLKTYQVGLGKLSESVSGCLTPLGKYSLGGKIAVYKPGITGLFQDKQVEMVRVFGTRWIPFDQELEGCTASAKGFGLHGAPWGMDQKMGQLVEMPDSVGKHESDGCISLTLEDMEELFAIVISKPTIVEIVKHFKDARLPGVEVASPMRQ